MVLDCVAKVPFSIIVLDLDYKIVYINKAFVLDIEEIDVSADIFIGRNVDVFIKNINFEAETKQEANITFDEGITFYDCLVSTMKKQDKKLVFIERPGRYIQKRIKRDFTLELSKKIKPPLITIVRMLNLLSNTKLNAEQIQYMETMKKNSIDILKINNDLVDYFKILTEPKQYIINPIYIDIKEISENITQVVKNKINERSLTLQFIHSNEIIYTDYQKLMQAMVNIIYNSIKHTKNGYIVVKITKEKTDIKIYVKDTGVSLNPCEIKLLDYVEKNSDLMSNLELPLAKQLSILLGGDITVEYTNNSGTLVCFNFPNQT